MSLAWVLRCPEITSALIGASTVAQVENAVGTLTNVSFTNEEFQLIENILA
jgi:L-glyceraldehyde 3-phosphate reductase